MADRCGGFSRGPLKTEQLHTRECLDLLSPEKPWTPGLGHPAHAQDLLLNKPTHPAWRRCFKQCVAAKEAPASARYSTRTRQRATIGFLQNGASASG